ncbi:hypothetical protein TETCHI2_000019 [Candidatus Hodgkinia cicadicola]|nr:hypothetical protein TETCHI2_000019 [Candidatus Hodgkinia cicadicola]
MAADYSRLTHANSVLSNTMEDLAERKMLEVKKREPKNTARRAHTPKLIMTHVGVLLTHCANNKRAKLPHTLAPNWN